MNNEKLDIIEQIFLFIKSCPILENHAEYDFAIVNVDFLSKEPASYGLEFVPSTTTIKQYIDGSKIKKKQFNLTSTHEYEENTPTNQNNLIFFQNFERWIDDINDKQNYPYETWQKIRINTGGYLFTVSEGRDVANYQIQLEVQYFEPKGDRKI